MDENDIPILCGIGLFIFILGLGFGSCRDNMQKEAIERGHAQWMTIQGERTFVWMKKGDTEPDIKIELIKLEKEDGR